MLTKAMANSSGPFNNGGDNLLYNVMRGGDFNTPGAATHQSGGYLFARNADGSFTNVGRAAPSSSPQRKQQRLNAAEQMQRDRGRFDSDIPRSISG